MTDKYKSIVAPVWAEFVAELKRTVKEGKQNPQRLLYQHNFFKAVMVEGKNESFVKCLDSITGEEVEVLKCIDKLLESANVKWADDAPTTVKSLVSTETPSSTVNAVEEKRESEVEVSVVKPRANSRKRTKKQGE